MDPVALLTLLGLVVAFYAIISPERRLDLRLRLNWLDWTLISLCIALVHYISYFDVLQSVGLTFDLGTWRYGFGPDNASYLIILFTGLFVGIHSRKSPLRMRKIHVFRELSERLMQEGKYSELVFLVEQHHRGLFRIYNSDFFLPQLKKKLSPSLEIVIKIIGEEEVLKPKPSISTKVKTILISFGGRLAEFLPSGEKSASVAEDIVRRIFLSEEFVAHFAKVRPYLALDILSHEFYEREDFLSLYVRCLLINRSSILYHEIRHNQYGSMERYLIDSRNRFISYFLSDAHIAEKTSIYKPFGDYAIDYLDELSLDPAHDPYNSPLLDYHEKDRWRCPIHATIRFFDVMIPESLFQGIEWHMWLYYFPPIADKILRNLAPKPNVDIDREWPTPYHCLLYEMVSALSDWIRAVEKVPGDQSNIVLKNDRVDHENSNIPKSAILALGQVIHSVMQANSLEMKFKSYLLETAIRTLEDLKNNQNTKQFAVVLRRSILCGGYEYNRDIDSYRETLYAALGSVDILLRQELDNDIE